MKIICDLCEKEINQKYGNMPVLHRAPGFWEKIRFWEHGPEREEIMVCVDCYQNFLKFIKNVEFIKKNVKFTKKNG